MKTARCALAFLLLASCSTSKESAPTAAPAAPAAPTKAPAAQTGVHASTVAAPEGPEVPLAGYDGQVLLIVNVASACGFTPQYEGLEKLEQELAPRGFHVLGFPCNQFGGQEPGTAQEIRTFCTEKYAVTFPLFSKLEVKGDGQAPLYKLLSEQTGQVPSWNFCKYLVAKDGHVIGFYNSKVKPDDADLRAAIEKALSEKG